MEINKFIVATYNISDKYYPILFVALGWQPRASCTVCNSNFSTGKERAVTNTMFRVTMLRLSIRLYKMMISVMGSFMQEMSYTQLAITGYLELLG